MCDICAEDLKTAAGGEGRHLLESELVKILAGFKGKAPYDCLVMCSGGKDSVMSLYYMKKRFGMTPLAMTFDHGFENEEAMANTRNAVEALGVDWIYYKTGYMKDAFSLMVSSRTRAPICHVCTIWYIGFCIDIAQRHRIPLIIGGWTTGQSRVEGYRAKEYTSMSEATRNFVLNRLRKIDKYRDFPESVEKALKRGNKKWKCTMISPHWFIKWDRDGAMRILENELGWRPLKSSYPSGSTNCLMNFVSVYLSLKHYGYTHYHIEMSRQIRNGEMSRAEAVEKLSVNFTRDVVNDICTQIGCIID